MESTEIEEKLKQITIEDYIWIVYLIIIFLSWYSNSLERRYYIYNDEISKEKYRKILIFIFSILVIVYIYFLKSSINDLNNLKENDSNKKKELITLSFIASLLIAISGFIFLYIALSDNDLNVELAFN
ncbi:MAG: hypothetical protein IJH18_04650 [Bacilli bacterium]|nr:hypothetical protein [Bacilli bacterium]